jgi:hypothetical protein
MEVAFEIASGVLRNCGCRLRRHPAIKCIDRRLILKAPERRFLTTWQSAVVGGTVGLLVSGLVLMLLWIGVAGVLMVGRSDLMYFLWPSSLMLTVTWGRTLNGIMTTIAAVVLNVLMYATIGILLQKGIRFSLGKSD